MIDSPLNVLVAEDDFLVSEEITRLARGLGWAVQASVGDGQAAVEKTCQLRPDVVLMDIKMPTMDGLEAARLIQRRCPTPVVVLTAHDAVDLVDRAARNGVGAYLSKPPESTQIQQAVAIAVARHRDLIQSRQDNQHLRQEAKHLTDALGEAGQLFGILPICGHCKRIRDEHELWHKLEDFLRRHTKAELSTGICPDCLKEHYTDLADNL